MEYLCNDIFMIRVLLLPLKTFFKHNTSDDNIIEYISKDTNINDFIKESLLISSKSLYKNFVNPSNSQKRLGT